MDPVRILACIDAPDPDNFVMIIALARLFPEADLDVLLTGRPVRFGADKSHPLWDYDMQSSRMAQEASAARLKNFLRHFGIEVPRVYDGGIAPRTLVPHWVHFAEYYKFQDVDPLAAIRHSELDPMEDFIGSLIGGPKFAVVVGGPMTGLAKMIQRHPLTAEFITEVHAMFATWGDVKLMDFDGPPRGAKQFNVACDPVAAYQVLMGLSCPVYQYPTEVTRVPEIGFLTAADLHRFLPGGNGAKALYYLYALWYDAAVKPRQSKNPEEMIYIHDVVGALGLDPQLRAKIYTGTPIEITDVPHLAVDHERWGEVLMKPAIKRGTQRWAAKGLAEGGAELYLETLKRILS